MYKMKYNCLQALIWTSIILNSLQKRIFLDYSEDMEATQLFKLLYSVKQGFYVDIGGYDPVFKSNTLHMYTNGWRGVNMQAHKNRAKRFYYVKKQDITVNQAIGKQNQFVKLYESRWDSMGTTSEAAAEFIKKSQKRQTLKYSQIASLSMGQLCERYFLSAPIFLNLDVQGLTSLALGLNNWTNPICLPDIFFFQFNVLDEKAIEKNQSQGTAHQILTNNNYVFFKNVTGPLKYTTNRIYIKGQKFEHYKKIYQEGDILFNENYKSVKFLQVFRQIRRYFNNKQNIEENFNHDDPNFYQVFHIRNRPLIIQEIIKQSNQISSYKNRPIFVFNFDPESSFILLSSSSHSSYSKQYITIGKNQYLKIQPFGIKNQSSIFIFDHKITQLSNFKIILSDQIQGNIKLQEKPEQLRKNNNQNINFTCNNLIVANITEEAKKNRQQIQQKSNFFSGLLSKQNQNLKNMQKILLEIKKNMENFSQISGDNNQNIENIIKQQLNDFENSIKIQMSKNKISKNNSQKVVPAPQNRALTEAQQIKELFSKNFDKINELINIQAQQKQEIQFKTLLILILAVIITFILLFIVFLYYYEKINKREGRIFIQENTAIDLNEQKK